MAGVKSSIVMPLIPPLSSTPTRSIPPLVLANDAITFAIILAAGSLTLNSTFVDSPFSIKDIILKCCPKFY